MHDDKFAPAVFDLNYALCYTSAAKTTMTTAVLPQRTKRIFKSFDVARNLSLDNALQVLTVASGKKARAARAMTFAGTHFQGRVAAPMSWTTIIVDQDSCGSWSVILTSLRPK